MRLKKLRRKESKKKSQNSRFKNLMLMDEIRKKINFLKKNVEEKT